MTLNQRNAFKEWHMANEKTGLKRDAKAWAVKIASNPFTWGVVLGIVLALAVAL